MSYDQPEPPDPGYGPERYLYVPWQMTVRGRLNVMLDIGEDREMRRRAIVKNLSECDPHELLDESNVTIERLVDNDDGRPPR